MDQTGGRVFDPFIACTYCDRPLKVERDGAVMAHLVCLWSRCFDENCGQCACPPQRREEVLNA